MSTIHNGNEAPLSFEIIKEKFNTENWDELILLGTAYLKGNPESEAQLMDTHYFLGVAHFKKSAYQQSIEHLLISTNNITSAEVYAMLAKAYDAIGKKEHVIASYEKAIELDNKNATILIDAARAQIRLHEDFQAAFQLLSAGIKVISEDDPNAFKLDMLYAERGNISLILNNFQEAIDDLSEAIKLDADRHLAWRQNRLGIANYHLKNYEDSLEYLQESQNNDEKYNDGQTNKLIGHCLYVREDHHEAISYYKKALDHGLEDYFVFYRLGNSLNQLELDFDLALDFINQGISLNPEFHWLYLEKGIILNKIKRYDDAIECLSKITNNNLALTSLEIAKSYLGKQQYDQALNYIDRAIEIDQEYELAFYEKAKTLSLAQRYNDALDCLSSFQFDDYWFESTTLKFELCIFLGHENLIIEITEELEQTYEDGYPASFEFLLALWKHLDNDFSSALEHYSNVKSVRSSDERRYLSLHYFIAMAEKGQLIEPNDVFISGNDEKILLKEDKSYVIKGLIKRASIEYYDDNGAFDYQIRLDSVAKALELDPRNVDAMIIKASIYLDSDFSEYNLDEGIKLLEECLKIQMHPTAILKLAKVTSDRHRALELLETLIRNDPHNKEVLTQLHNNHFEMGNYAKSIQALESIVNYQDDPWILADIAKSTFYLGKYDEAILMLEKIISTDEDPNIDWIVILAKCYLALNRIEDAFIITSKTINAHYPHAITELVELGIQLCELLNDTETKSIFDQILSLSKCNTNDEKLEYLLSLESSISKSDTSIFSNYHQLLDISKKITNPLLESATPNIKRHLKKNPSITKDQIDLLKKSDLDPSSLLSLQHLVSSQQVREHLERVKNECTADELEILLEELTDKQETDGELSVTEAFILFSLSDQESLDQDISVVLRDVVYNLSSTTTINVEGTTYTIQCEGESTETVRLQYGLVGNHDDEQVLNDLCNFTEIGGTIVISELHSNEFDSELSEFEFFSNTFKAYLEDGSLVEDSELISEIWDMIDADELLAVADFDEFTITTSGEVSFE